MQENLSDHNNIFGYTVYKPPPEKNLPKIVDLDCFGEVVTLIDPNADVIKDPAVQKIFKSLDGERTVKIEDLPPDVRYDGWNKKAQYDKQVISKNMGNKYNVQPQLPSISQNLLKEDENSYLYHQVALKEAQMKAETAKNNELEFSKQLQETRAALEKEIHRQLVEQLTLRAQKKSVTPDQQALIEKLYLDLRLINPELALATLKASATLDGSAQTQVQFFENPLSYQHDQQERQYQQQQRTLQLQQQQIDYQQSRHKQLFPKQPQLEETEQEEGYKNQNPRQIQQQQQFEEMEQEEKHKLQNQRQVQQHQNQHSHHKNHPSQHESHQRESHQRELHQRELHQRELHQRELHQRESHQREPFQNESYKHQMIPQRQKPEERHLEPSKISNRQQRVPPTVLLKPSPLLVHNQGSIVSESSRNNVQHTQQSHKKTLKEHHRK